MSLLRAGAVPWARFPKGSCYRLDVMARAASVAMVFALASAPVFAWPFVDRHPQDGFVTGVYAALVASCIVLAACIVRFAFNFRLEMGALALIRHRLFASRPLPYTDITALTASRDVRHGSWRIELHTRDGSGLGIFVDDRHLRDDDLLAWLAAIPRRGGDAITRSKHRRVSPIVVDVVSGCTLVVLATACTAFSLLPFQLARHVVEGYPPLAQLNRTEGTVVRLEPCHRQRRGGAHLSVVVRDAVGDHPMQLSCDFEPVLRRGAWPHHLVAYREQRLLDDPLRQVDIDGTVVASYADFVAGDRQDAPFNLAAELLLVAAAWALALGFALSWRQRT